MVRGVVLGLACGLLFGEYCRSLTLIGEAYIKLLQMTVLPYITVSLILGFGSLTASQARQLASKGGALLLLFWAIALGAVVFIPFSFPRWQSAAFFSSSLLQQPEQKDLLDLFIPSNPFHSLAENMVPAIILFHPAGCRAHGRDGEIGTPAHIIHRLRVAEPRDEVCHPADAARAICHRGLSRRNHEPRGTRAAARLPDVLRGGLAVPCLLGSSWNPHGDDAVHYREKLWAFHETPC